MHAWSYYLDPFNLEPHDRLILSWASVLVPAILMLMIRRSGVRFFLSLIGVILGCVARLYMDRAKLPGSYPYEMALDGICAGFCMTYAFLYVRKATDAWGLWVWAQALLGLYSWWTMLVRMLRCVWHDPDPFWARVYYYAGWNTPWMLLLAWLVICWWPQQKKQEPACLSCGYCLEGLAADSSCPECGQQQKRSPVEG